MRHVIIKINLLVQYFLPQKLMNIPKDSPTGKLLCKPQSPSSHMSCSFDPDKLVPDTATDPYVDEPPPLKECSPSDDDDYNSDDNEESSPQPTTPPLHDDYYYIKFKWLNPSRK